MAAGFLHGNNLLPCRLIVSCCYARNPVISHISFGKGIRKGIFLIGVRRNPQLFVVFVKHTLQGKVADGVCHTVNKFLFKGGFGHQRRALGNLVHPLLQFHSLSHMVGTHHIEHAGFGLYHVRAAAAGIGDGIMDARLIAHMLPQILHACVHQFYRIQGAASLLRRACCMGCNAVELILGLNAGIGGTGGYLIDVLRVPGQRRVQTLPDAVPRHKSLGSRTGLRCLPPDSVPDKPSRRWLLP